MPLGKLLKVLIFHHIKHLGCIYGSQYSGTYMVKLRKKYVDHPSSECGIVLEIETGLGGVYKRY